jgi:uncharacterized protein (TIGR03083 family)
MALDRTDVSTGLVTELRRFEALIRPLSVAEWDKPSRCEGWTVGDVARHVVGSMADVTSGRLDGLGTPEVTEREVAERAGRSAAELADECAAVTTAAEAMLPAFDDAAWAAPAPGGYDGTLGDGVEALWYDTWLHADDIRAAIGEPTDVNDSLRGVLSHVAFELEKRGWKGEVPDARAGDAAVEFVLVATGRAPASGPGAPVDIYA